MIRIGSTQKNVIEVECARDSDLTEEELKQIQGYRSVEFYCPRCGSWIGSALLKPKEDFYEIVLSRCSSDYQGLDCECRSCNPM